MVKGLFSNFFLSLGCSFPVPLDRESRLLLGPLLTVPVGVLRLSASTLPNLEDLRQNQNPDDLWPCHSSGPKVRTWSGVPCSLHVSESSFFVFFKVFFFIFLSYIRAYLINNVALVSGV